MKIMEYMLIPLKKYADFNGRARRKEYWMFVLFSILIGIPIGLVDEMLFDVSSGGTGILGLITSLGLFIPSIAVAVRRMHDVGKSGWFCLLPIYNIILAIAEGDKGPNEYGPDPKKPESEIEVIGENDLV